MRKGFLPVFLLAFSTIHSVTAAETPSIPSEDENEPIPFLQRYKPTFFLLGKPITKVQLSFKVQILRGVPLHFGFTQLMMWDLFKESAPFRDLNYNPELFYRLSISEEKKRSLDVGLEHESNGKLEPDSRSWNRTYLRYTQRETGKDHKWWWSLKVWYPFSVDDSTRKLLEHRGVWEFQIAGSSLFKSIFEVNELILRIYAGGRSRVNLGLGGQELTYREKGSERKFLLPLYLQIFHGYGENQLDAGDNHWGFRAGIGF